MTWTSAADEEEKRNVQERVMPFRTFREVLNALAAKYCGGNRMSLAAYDALMTEHHRHDQELQMLFYEQSFREAGLGNLFDLVRVLEGIP